MKYLIFTIGSIFILWTFILISIMTYYFIKMIKEEPK